jgi:hypothetical protein
LINDLWREKSPLAVLENLPYSRSDHRPLLLSLKEAFAQDSTRSSVLRFEAKWLREARFNEIVEAAWDNTRNSSLDLAGRLHKIHSDLHHWDRSVLQRNRKRIRAAQRELEQVSVSDLIADNVKKHEEIAKEIEKLLEQEELHWAQRSRINWLQHGDKNTSYFQNFANARKQKNKIKKLKNSDGAWIQGTAYLNPMISDYFSGLFATEVYDTDPEVLNKVVPRVTREMNDRLRRPFEAAEVKKGSVFYWRHEGARHRWTSCNFFQKVLEHTWRSSYKGGFGCYQ